MLSATQPHWLVVACLAATLAACVVADLKTRRIPNAITGAAMVTGAALNFALNGTTGLAGSLLGITLGLVILTPPFLLGGIGGGDVKMMGAAGSFVGPAVLSIALVTGLMLGGVVAIGAAASRGRLRHTLGSTWAMTAGAVAARSAEPLRSPTKRPGRILLPYSVPLALGALMAVGWTMVSAT